VVVTGSKRHSIPIPILKNFKITLRQKTYFDAEAKALEFSLFSPDGELNHLFVDSRRSRTAVSVGLRDVHVSVAFLCPMKYVGCFFTPRGWVGLISGSP
jgi:hypothetical protein